MFRMNRDMRRMLEKMGVKITELSNVREVIIRTDREEYVIREPAVNLVSMQGTTSFEIIGGTVTRSELKREEPQQPEIKEEDIVLVAREAGVSRDEAERALRESNGDIALAILKLEERKRS